MGNITNKDEHDNIKLKCKPNQSNINTRWYNMKMDASCLNEFELFVKKFNLERG